MGSDGKVRKSKRAATDDGSDAEAGSGSGEERPLDLTVITGMSGAGKSEVVATYEDMGYFCIDNLPPRMIANALELFSLEGSRVDKVALVFDARGGGFFEELGQALEYLRSSGTGFRMLYLDASDEALVARYQASRRPHPLSDRLREGIAQERRLLTPLKGEADTVIDTTNLSPWQLRRHLEETLLADNLKAQLFVSLLSFGYRYGIPDEADIVLDARFLPNPHWDPELRKLSGSDEAVGRYVVGRDEAEGFLQRVVDMLLFVAPHFLAEQKKRLVVAVGCTGGRHRSVALTEELAKRLSAEETMVVSFDHRDVSRLGER